MNRGSPPLSRSKDKLLGPGDLKIQKLLIVVTLYPSTLYLSGFSGHVLSERSSG